MAPIIGKALLSLFAGASPILPRSHQPSHRDIVHASPSPTTTQPTSYSSSSSSPASNKELVESLLLAPSQQDKLSILVPAPSNAANLTFTFFNNTVVPPTGGSIDLADVNKFPALQLGNVAAAVGFVNPCALNTPHSHPRATEFLTVVQGELFAGLVLEENPGSAGEVVGGPPADNGLLAQVGITLGLWQGTVLPQGEVHFQFNPKCEPAVFAAAFDNRDPGRIQTAKSFFSIQPDEVLESALGEDVSALEASRIDQLVGQIPGSYAELMRECAVRCGIVKPD